MTAEDETKLRRDILWKLIKSYGPYLQTFIEDERDDVAKGIKTQLNFLCRCNTEPLEALNIVFGGAFIVDNDELRILQPNNQKYEIVKHSWTLFTLQRIKSFTKVNRSSTENCIKNAFTLGIEISARTVYPVTFRGGDVMLTDNYNYLVDCACKKIGCDNIFLEVFTKSEISHLGGKVLNGCKTELLQADLVDLNPKPNTIEAIAVSAVFKGEQRLRKIYGTPQLVTRMSFKMGNLRGRASSESQGDHIYMEMLKKTALRFYCKELGVTSVVNLDVATDV